MSKDYARTRRPSSRKRGSSSIPGWVWLLTGIVTGAFVMFLVYLSGLAPSVGSTPAKLVTNAPSQKVPEIDLKKNLQKPIFEFYDTLMNSEVINTAPQASNKTDPASSPATAPVYMLQVASFKKSTDADSLKAQLTLEGLSVNLAEFNNRGEIYYRVMVGPFTNSQKMTDAKKTLATHNLNPIVLQKKSGT